MARTDPFWWPTNPNPVPPTAPPGTLPTGLASYPPVYGTGLYAGPPSPPVSPASPPAALPSWLSPVLLAAGGMLGSVLGNGGSGTGTGSNPYATPPPASAGSGGYRGGGGGGGGGSDPWFGIPAQYRTGFENVFGTGWYTPEHGGDNQIKSDYQTVANAYGNYAQRWPDPDAWTPFLNGFAGYAKTLDRPVLPGDMAGYADLTMRRQPTAPPVSYLQTGEI